MTADAYLPPPPTPQDLEEVLRMARRLRRSNPVRQIAEALIGHQALLGVPLSRAEPQEVTPVVGKGGRILNGDAERLLDVLNRPSVFRCREQILAARLL